MAWSCSHINIILPHSCFVSDSHRAVCCARRGAVLNLVAKESAGARSGIVRVARLSPRETVSELRKVASLELPSRHHILPSDFVSARMVNLFHRLEERPPGSFEDALLVEGLGPKSLRALNLLSELIYGTRTSTRDPARYSFAHGGKDGVPYPVDRENYDRSIAILEGLLNKSRVDYYEKRRAFARLARMKS
ncbi:MAG: DUF763 domain-containing protein [PVC group bacterium]